MCGALRSEESDKVPRRTSHLPSGLARAPPCGASIRTDGSRSTFHLQMADPAVEVKIKWSGLSGANAADEPGDGLSEAKRFPSVTSKRMVVSGETASRCRPSGCQVNCKK